MTSAGPGLGGLAWGGPSAGGPSLGGAGRAALAMPPGSGEQVFPARPEQVGAARRFVARLLSGAPVADDAVLCVSELTGNCVSHSVSGCPGGTFTVRVELHDGDYVWLEVADQGGPWRPSAPDGRVHGLEIVRRLATESGVAGSVFTGWEAWARLDWPGHGFQGRR
ncbi:MAG: ATP-binding protein [Streptosporangiaceae bacterium]